MKKSIIISIVFLAVSIVGYSQTITNALRDSITNRLAGDWYWVGTSGGLVGGGYGGPIENGYIAQIRLEKKNENDSLKFTVYKNDVVQRTGKCYFTTDPSTLNTYRINNIMPDEHSDIMSPPDIYYDMQFQFMNKDSILFLNNGWADSYEYIYSRIPCKNCYTHKFITENKLWRYSSQVSGDGIHFSYNNIAYRFKGDSVINDTTYNKLYSSEDEFLLKWKLYGVWRETSDHKIFERSIYRPPYNIEYLNYDFALSKNDTFIVDGISLKVDSVITKLWGGKMRKHWYLYPVHAEGDTIKEWDKTLWVEDVGQIDYFPSSVGGLIGALNILLCFEENSQQVYQNPEYNTCFYTSLNDIPKPDKGFKVYPNPFSGELLIHPNTNIDEGYSLEMYSVKGELVKTECLESGSMLHRINTSSLRNGIYILRLISASGKQDEKVIVKE